MRDKRYRCLRCARAVEHPGPSSGGCGPCPHCGSPYVQWTNYPQWATRFWSERRALPHRWTVFQWRAGGSVARYGIWITIATTDDPGCAEQLARDNALARAERADGKSQVYSHPMGTSLWIRSAD